MQSLERRRNWLVVGGMAAALGVLLLAYPHLLGEALTRLGVRAVAAALLAIAAVPLLLAGTTGWRAAPLGPASLGVPLLLAGAVVTGERVWLLLMPAAVYVALAGLFAGSLRAPDSLIERAVRRMVPPAPDFIRPYCRGLTRFWAGFFLLCALGIAALALAGPEAAWRTFTGTVVYAAMLAISALEFFVRKTWFRHYFHGGPFDRLWSRLFPAENTAQGRRSLEYIRRFRHEERRREDELTARS